MNNERNPWRAGNYHTVKCRSFLWIALLLTVLVFMMPVSSALSQSWGSTTGLMQAERIARVSSIYADTIRATSDTTHWVAFGTHSSSLAGERLSAPTRFTLFVHADTSGIPHAAGPSITLHAEIALSDTLEPPYTQMDGSLDLVPETDPIATTAGKSLMVPVYGGGWIRFIVTSADTAKVNLDFWRVH